VYQELAGLQNCSWARADVVLQKEEKNSGILREIRVSLN